MLLLVVGVKKEFIKKKTLLGFFILKLSYVHRVHAFNGFSEFVSGIEEDHLHRGQLSYSCLKLIGLVTEWQNYKQKGAFRCLFFYVFLKISQDKIIKY